MPEGEDLATFAKSGATLAIHLSINNLAKVVRELTPFYGEACPGVIGFCVSGPDQMILRGVLGDIRAKAKASGITRTALILVGPALAAEGYEDSRLYASDHTHVLRPAPDKVS